MSIIVLVAGVVRPAHDRKRSVHPCVTGSPSIGSAPDVAASRSPRAAVMRCLIAIVALMGFAPRPAVLAQPIDQIVDAAAGGHGLSFPEDIAVDSADNVYVTGGLRVLKIAPGGTITAIIDTTGDGMHGLTASVAVAVDRADNVYVAGLISGNAFKIAPGGAITQIIDATGDGMHALDAPEGIAVDSANNVYVAGRDSDNVFKISPDNTITQIMDATGDGTHGLDSPGDLAVDSADNVYVVGVGSVFKIASGGTTITQIIDSTGDGMNDLLVPTSVAVDSEDNVYVTGGASDNAFKIAPGGAITQIIDATGDGTHALDAPVGVAVDSAGNVYVIGTLSNNAFKITPGGAITQIIDATGDGTHALDRAVSIACDRRDNVYVVGALSDNAFKIGDCGGATLDAGEQCDDGNDVDGDCCSLTCRRPSGCKGAGSSMLLLKNNGDKDKLLWKWLKGEATTADELGTPTDMANYTLCLYGGAGATAATIPGGANWQALGATGFKYKDKSAAADGVHVAVLKSGAAGKARAIVKGKGANLPDALAPPLALPLTAQLIGDETGACFEAVFDSGDVIKNDDKQFKAKAQP